MWIDEYSQKPGFPNVGIPADLIENQPYSTVIGSQVTDSEGHDIRRLNASSGDMGGPFFSQRKSYVGNPANAHLSSFFSSGGNWQRSTSLSGTVLPCNPASIPFPPAIESSDAQLTALGTKAVRYSAPSLDAANLGVALAELKDGFSVFRLHAWEEIASQLKQAGSNYLALQFGYQPLVSEIYDVANGVMRARDSIRQYVRDAGKIVRRRWDFPLNTSNTSTFFVNDVPYMGGKIGNGITMSPVGSVFRLRTTSVRQWFSGAFQYGLPYGQDSQRIADLYADRAEQVLNVSLTPEVLWEIAPWSWAVDWFAQVGDVIHNLQARQQDGLVMRYGYLMEHSMVKDTYTRTAGLPLVGGVPLSTNPSFSLITETKKRIRANPFGFGVSWSGLSPFQLSIAAALGLSRR